MSISDDSPGSDLNPILTTRFYAKDLQLEQALTGKDNIRFEVLIPQEQHTLGRNPKGVAIGYAQALHEAFRNEFGANSPVSVRCEEGQDPSKIIVEYDARGRMDTEREMRRVQKAFEKGGVTNASDIQMQEAFDNLQLREWSLAEAEAARRMRRRQSLGRGSS